MWFNFSLWVLWIMGGLWGQIYFCVYFGLSLLEVTCVGWLGGSVGGERGWRALVR